MNSLTPIFTNAWSFISDFLIVIVLFAALFAFVKYAGRSGFVTLIAALYIGYALYILFPYASSLPTAPATTALFASLGLYLVLVLFSYFAFKRSIASDYGSQNVFAVAFACLLTTGFVIALLYHAFPVHAVYALKPTLASLFPKTYFFWWFIAPLVGLLFFKR